MKKLLLALIMAPLIAVAQVPQNVQKLSGALTQSFTVPSGVSITATGTGTIAATTVTGFSPASGKVLTLSNTLTFTGTDSSSVNFGAGGTVLYSGGAGFVASITGTTNQVIASASTGAVTLSLPQSIATTSTPTFAATVLTDGTSPSTFGSATSVTFPVAYVNFNTTAYASLPRVGTADYNNSFSIFAKDATTGNLTIAAYGSNAAFRMDAADGTAASPTTLTTAFQVGSFQWRGYNGTSFITVAAVTAYTEEAFTGIASGTGLSFRTTAVGTLGGAQKMALRGNGNLLLSLNGAPNLGTDNGNGKLQILSTSATDGIALGSRAAEVIYRTGNDALRTDSAWRVASTTASTVPTDGSGIFGGGVGVAGMVNAGLQVRSYRSGSTTQYVQLDGGDSGHIGVDAVGGDKPLNIAVTSNSGTHSSDIINFYSGSGPTQALTVSGTRSSTAWGTAGVAARFFANTFTDSSSSGTVASAVAHSFAQPTFSATSSTTFTAAANVYIAGDVTAGSNVTLTSTYGLWNAGKTRLDGILTFGSGGPQLSGSGSLFNYSNSVGGSTLVQFTSNSTAGVINIARLASSSLSGQISGVLGDNATSGLALSYGGGQQAAIELGTGSINFFTNTGTTWRGGFDDGGGLSLARSNGTKTAWTTNGVAFAVRAATFTDSSTAGSATVATNVVSSFAIPTLAATNSSVTYTNAATVYIAGIPVAGTNVTLTNSWALWVAAGRARFDGGVTTLGGATFLTTNSALTDGAGVALGTLATAPAAGNPTKWIGINDNGTTRYVPAW